MDLERLRASVRKTWDESILERLIAYVRIPNKSPLFDPQWESHGHMEAAVQLMAKWAREQPLAGMRVEVQRLPGRTPLLVIDIPGELPAERDEGQRRDPAHRRVPAGGKEDVPVLVDEEEPDQQPQEDE